MSRYKNTKAFVDINGRNYKGRVDYPKFPLKETDTYYVTISGDRLDLLANDFYGDSRYWWIISRAYCDKIKTDSFFIDPGLQIRIPSNITQAYEKFTRINQ